MTAELDLYGLFVPQLLACAVVALLLQALLRRVLARLGLYRLLWHPPLADLALFVICLGGLVFLLNRI